MFVCVCVSVVFFFKGGGDGGSGLFKVSGHIFCLSSVGMFIRPSVNFKY